MYYTLTENVCVMSHLKFKLCFEGPEAVALSVPAARQPTRPSRGVEATRGPALPQSPSPDPGLADDLKKVKQIFEQNNVIQSTRQFFKNID